MTQYGDIWQLGTHRLMCGDSCNRDDAQKLMDGNKAVLLHSDPPYGMNKKTVKNDNLHKSDLDKFQLAWWQIFRPHIADNASVYIWGNPADLWRLWYTAGLSESETLTFRNEIVWDKNSGQGMRSADFRCYPTASERCLFFIVGAQGFNTNAYFYFEAYEPVREYLDTERKRLGWHTKDCKRIAGYNYGSGFCHWFDRSQWMLPKKEAYQAWQKAANSEAFLRDYDELKAVVDNAKKAYLETFAYFDNAHDKMTDVWRYGRVTGKERYEHETPKPVEMMQRIVKTSARVNDIVIEPFAGTGSTLIACEKEQRICYTMEIEPKYCDIVINRWQELTGQTAELLHREGLAA